MAEGGDTGLPAWVERDTIAVAAFREYSVAQAHEATVHPRWEELKARADQALKDGDLDGAIEGFTSVLSIAEATHAVAALFDLLSSWPADSAGAQLAAAKDDIAPIVREYLPGPVLARGEPNRPVAICLTNRATAHLQAGRPEAAVADARAATLACPEYIKGHYCLGQAAHSLLCPPHLRGAHSSVVPSSPPRPASAAAEECTLQGGAWEAGGGPTDSVVPAIHPRSAALIRRFEDLSRPENPMAALGRATGATHRHPLQTWLGFRLVMCGWLPPSTYYPVYEDPRASAWRDLARRAIGNELLTPGSGPDDYRFLRVHIEVHDPTWIGSTTGPRSNDHPLADSDFLPVSLHVTPTRPRVLSGPCRVAPPPELPSSIEYRHLRLPMRLDDPALDAAATGRMVATALSAMFRADGGLPMVATLGLGGVGYDASRSDLARRSRTCGHRAHGVALSAHAEAVRSHFEAEGLLAPVPGYCELDALVVLHAAGHPVTHRKFGYRGVIVGAADHTCAMDARWIAQMGVDRLPRGRYQPWYSVLVDVRDRSPPQMCYVCHENLLLWRDPPDQGGERQGGADPNPLGGPIDHPDVLRAFGAYDAAARMYR